MRLYKYCDGGGIEILRSCSIKVSSPMEVNDPFDCKPVPDNWTPESREALKSQIQEKSGLWKALAAGSLPPGSPPGADLDSMRRHWHQVLEENVANHDEVSRSMDKSLSGLALLCLSARKSHHLMWAHYADKHRGIVIEIETEGEFPEGTVESVTDKLYKVVYSEIRPVFRFDSISPQPAFTIKGSAWSYEEEWRVLYHASQFKPRVIGGREMLLRPIHPHSIKAVYFGCLIPDSTRKDALFLLNERRLRHVDLFQMELDRMSFKLNETPVDRG